MRFHRSSYNDNGVVVWASKHARRKRHYLKGISGWGGNGTEDRRAQNRRSRRTTKTSIRKDYP